jgi:hypothetical protein
MVRDHSDDTSGTGAQPVPDDAHRHRLGGGRLGPFGIVFPAAPRTNTTSFSATTNTAAQNTSERYEHRSLDLSAPAARSD